jgi:hypothetical protein
MSFFDDDNDGEDTFESTMGSIASNPQTPATPTGEWRATANDTDDFLRAMGFESDDDDDDGAAAVAPVRLVLEPGTPVSPAADFSALADPALGLDLGQWQITPPSEQRRSASEMRGAPSSTTSAVDDSPFEQFQRQQRAEARPSFEPSTPRRAAVTPARPRSAQRSLQYDNAAQYDMDTNAWMLQMPSDFLDMMMTSQMQGLAEQEPMQASGSRTEPIPVPESGNDGSDADDESARRNPLDVINREIARYTRNGDLYSRMSSAPETLTTLKNSIMYAAYQAGDARDVDSLYGFFPRTLEAFTGAPPRSYDAAEHEQRDQRVPSVVRTDGLSDSHYDGKYVQMLGYVVRRFSGTNQLSAIRQFCTRYAMSRSAYRTVAVDLESFTQANETVRGLVTHYTAARIMSRRNKHSSHCNRDSTYRTTWDLCTSLFVHATEVNAHAVDGHMIMSVLNEPFMGRAMKHVIGSDAVNARMRAHERALDRSRGIDEPPSSNEYARRLRRLTVREFFLHALEQQILTPAQACAAIRYEESNLAGLWYDIRATLARTREGAASNELYSMLLRIVSSTKLACMPLNEYALAGVPFVPNETGLFPDTFEANFRVLVRARVLSPFHVVSFAQYTDTGAARYLRLNDRAWVEGAFREKRYTDLHLQLIMATLEIRATPSAVLHNFGDAPWFTSRTWETDRYRTSRLDELIPADRAFVSNYMYEMRARGYFSDAQFRFMLAYMHEYYAFTTIYRNGALVFQPIYGPGDSPDVAGTSAASASSAELLE